MRVQSSRRGSGRRYECHAAGCRLERRVGCGESVVGPKPVVLMRNRQARFVTRCTFSHRLADDPIVKPNQPGLSHSHDFFGNVTTDAASTLPTLAAGGTTCINPQDHSGYWVPSLSVNGIRVDPRFANIYYQSGGQGLSASEDDPARPRGRCR